MYKIQKNKTLRCIEFAHLCAYMHVRVCEFGRALADKLKRPHSVMRFQLHNGSEMGVTVSGIKAGE